MKRTWGSPLFLGVIQYEKNKKKKKQTDFSYCHMPLLNNQISHPPRNRGCTESHYLLWLRGERQHFFFDFLCKTRGGVCETMELAAEKGTGHHVVLLICTYIHIPSQICK